MTIDSVCAIRFDGLGRFLGALAEVRIGSQALLTVATLCRVDAEILRGGTSAAITVVAWWLATLQSAAAVTAAIR